MSTSSTSAPPARRVRHEVRDQALVMGFTALASGALAGALLLLTALVTR